MKNRDPKSVINSENIDSKGELKGATIINQKMDANTHRSLVINSIKTLIGLNQLASNLVDSNLLSMLNLSSKCILQKTYLDALRDKTDLHKLFVPIPVRSQEEKLNSIEIGLYDKRVHLQSWLTKYGNGQSKLWTNNSQNWSDEEFI